LHWSGHWTAADDGRCYVELENHEVGEDRTG
jgi:hypothetical protein